MTSKQIVGKIASIETMGLVDGPGIRTIIFLQGCPLRCLYCHNPDMQAKENTASRTFTPEQVVEFLKKYKTYYKKTGGVTFSGGEPLMQKAFLLECLKLCKKEGINTAIDTSGAIANCEEILDYADLVILDIKACEKEEYARITGGKIEVFEQFVKECQKKNKKLWLRQVIVPGINDDEKHILLLKNYIKNIKNVERMELLPYHTMGKTKYKTLGLAYPLGDTPEMDKQKCKQLEKVLLGIK